MKGVWIEAPGVSHYGNVPDPVPPKGWVRLQIKAAAICGSDMNVYKRGRQYKVDQRVSGHEFVGVVDQVGDESLRSRIGQRVCAYPVLYCNECEYCKSGHINMCRNKKFVGGRHYNGGLAEYTMVPEYVLMNVPEQVSDVEAAMVEPFAVGLHALHQAGGEKLKDGSLLIYGAGPIGLFAMEAAKYYGLKQIIMMDLSESRLEIAKKHGATEIICANESSEILEAKILKLTKGKGVDAVIDAVGTNQTMDNSMRFCKPLGTISVVGLLGHSGPVDYKYLVSKELKLVGAYTYNKEMQECLDILGSASVSIAYIANPIEPLSHGPEVFEKLVKKPEECLKAVLIPDKI